MRLPKDPSSLGEFFKRTDLAELFSKIHTPAVAHAVLSANEDYIHWDHLRFRPTPPGLTSGEFWFATKLSRQSSEQKLPIAFYRKGQALTYNSPAKNQELVHEIDKKDSKFIEKVSGGWPMILGSLKSLLETGQPLEATRKWPKGV